MKSFDRSFVVLPLIAVLAVAVAPPANAGADDWAGLVLVRPARIVDEPGTGAPALPAGQDGDGFPDTDETVDLSVILSNKSGQSLTDVSVRLWTVDSKVDCISNPVVAFGSVAAGASVASPASFRFRVAPTADRAGTSPAASCAAGTCSNGAGRCAVAGDCSRTILESYAARFFATVTASQLPAGGETDAFEIELDLNSSVAASTTATVVEGFETGLGNMFMMNLDASLESNALSNGKRCQYNDPDFPNSNSYGDSECYLGFPAGQDPVNDWHVHATTHPDGGRAFLGSRSLHYGIHGDPGFDTYALSQMDAIRTKTPIHLSARVCRDDPAIDMRSCNAAADCVAVGGGPCVAARPELSFAQQISLENDRYTANGPRTTDRAVVQVRNQTGTIWKKVFPYENVYDRMTTEQFRNCSFDPDDDGNNEDSYFQPGDPARRIGPSSTCNPEFAFSYMGDTDAPFAGANLGYASDGPGLPGSLGIGTWVTSRFDLSAFRGRSITIRWLISSTKVWDSATWQDLFQYNPSPFDDGWYVDDVRVTQTLGISTPTVSLDSVDRSSLPACSEACSSVMADLVATPSTTPAPGNPVSFSAAASTADVCPGGQLLYEYWVDGDANGSLGDAQDWAYVTESFSTAAGAVPTETTTYGVRVRCSSRPSCVDDATEQVVVLCPPATTYAANTWWASLHFANKSNVHLHEAGQVGDAVRGLLSTLRSTGAFGGETCHRNDVPIDFFYDVDRPPAGDGYYYIVRGTEPWCAESATYSTYHPREDPAAPGKRDLEITICPAP